MTADIASLPERAQAKINPNQDTGCWLWTGSGDSNGYGQIRVAGRTIQAHRFTYSELVGTIPAGMVIDHLCHNRRCVNPEHLEVVTQQVNSWRRAGADPDSITGVRGVKYIKKLEKYQASARWGGVDFYFGLFRTLEEATAAVVAGRAEIESRPVARGSAATGINRRGLRWSARAKRGGVNRYLGTYATEAEAKAARAKFLDTYEPTDQRYEPPADRSGL